MTVERAALARGSRGDTQDNVAWAPVRHDRLAALEDEMTGCRDCPRLVTWREEVAATRRAGYLDQDYWGRPVPGFGDPAARLLLVGLAPAAHGGNRTGRMFTGDRSGDFLYAALWRAGYSSQPGSVSRTDGLTLQGAFVTAAVRCAPPANRPQPDERDRCARWLTGELDELREVKVVLALGAFALDALSRQRHLELSAPPAGRGLAGGPAGRTRGARPRFAHGAELGLADGRTVLCSYHPSQRNVFTGLLTPAMFDAVLARARELGG